MGMLQGWGINLFGKADPASSGCCTDSQRFPSGITNHPVFLLKPEGKKAPLRGINRTEKRRQWVPLVGTHLTKPPEFRQHGVFPRDQGGCSSPGVRGINNSHSNCQKFQEYNPKSPENTPEGCPGIMRRPWWAPPCSVQGSSRSWASQCPLPPLPPPPPPLLPCLLSQMEKSCFFARTK